MKTEDQLQFQVLLTGPIPAEHLACLAAKAGLTHLRPGFSGSEPALLDALVGCDAVVSFLSERLSGYVIEMSPRLKVIANVAVGYDNIDLEAASRKGVLVTNTPGVLDETTADLAFGLLIACARRIVEADSFVRNGQWSGWLPDLMLGVDIHAKTLGIVGFGRIGRAVARRALGFGMKVQYVAKREGERKLTPELAGCKSTTLHELLASSDFVSLHCPLAKDTFHLIGQAELSVIKHGAILVNTSRGAVVDQMALLAALESGRLGGAGLDVFEEEPAVPAKLIERKNVVLTPHIGSASVETRAKMAELAVNGLLTAIDGRLPSNAVNPEVWPQFVNRLAIVGRSNGSK
jgi:glyoxylate reductase